MKKLILVVATFVAGIAVGRIWYQRGPSDASTDALAISGAHPIALDEDEMRKNPPLIPTSLDDHTGLIFARLGLRNGDGPEEINDVPFSADFKELVAGYNRGHLCVKYKRGEKFRLACFDRRSTGEQVVDRGL